MFLTLPLYIVSPVVNINLLYNPLFITRLTNKAIINLQVFKWLPNQLKRFKEPRGASTESYKSSPNITVKYLYV